MLKKLKVLLFGIAEDDGSKDALLKLLLDTAIEDARVLTGIEDYTAVSSIIVRMAEYLYNTRGTSGLNSESYSGVSYNYTGNYPDYLLNALEAYAKSKVGGRGWLRTL